MTEGNFVGVGDESGDSALMFRAAQGDERAYRSLYRRHAARVYRQAMSVVADTWDAEEVAAAAFLELWRRRAEVRIVDDSILPWLLTTTNYVAKNSIRSKLRYGRLIRKLPPQEPQPDHAEMVEDSMIVTSHKVAVAAALSKLNAQDASVITLCLMEELTMSDAAIVLGVPEGTVKSRLSRARTKLQAHLAPVTGTWVHAGEVPAND